MRLRTGTRVPANTGVPPRRSGELVIRGFGNAGMNESLKTHFKSTARPVEAPAAFPGADPRKLASASSAPCRGTGAFGWVSSEGPLPYENVLSLHPTCCVHDTGCDGLDIPTQLI